MSSHVRQPLNHERAPCTRGRAQDMRVPLMLARCGEPASEGRTSVVLCGKFKVRIKSVCRQYGMRAAGRRSLRRGSEG